MSRRVFGLVAFAVVLAPGCIPVTNPVGDIEKAEPDKSLVGVWVSTKNTSDKLRIETQEVKGVPKGLMTMTALGTDPERDPIWFFPSPVGKERFGNLCMDVDGDKGSVLPNFGKDRAYARWAKSKGRLYIVFRYSAAKDEITLNFGDEKAYDAVAKEAKLKEVKEGLYETPEGWLAGYLEKNGSDKLFPADKDVKFTRAKE
jgi:hypothetical protein